MYRLEVNGRRDVCMEIKRLYTSKGAANIVRFKEVKKYKKETQWT